VTGAIREAGARLECRLDQPTDVFADRVQIQQVIVNLVRNGLESLRNESERLITVTTKIRPETVEFIVHDCGAGLDPDVAERLFQAFVSTKRDGLGMGLSICRTIVEAHGGRIWATSPGSGARFHFTLCRKAGETHAEA